MRIRDLILAPLLLAALATAVQAEQATWPKSSIRFVVPTSAGGGTDTVARVLAERLNARAGWTVVVENRAGGGGNIGTEFVARNADSHTFLVTQNTHTSNVGFFKKLPFDAIKDFAPVAFIGTYEYMICSNPAVPAKTMPELIAYVRSKDGRVNYGHPGVGTGMHLAMEQLKEMTGVQMTHVPYRGTTPMLSALIANEIDLGIAPSAAVLPFVQAGTLRCYASTAIHRSPLFPELPTVAESINLPTFDHDCWYGVLAAVETPKPVVERMHAEIETALRDPAVTNRFRSMGIVAKPLTPSAFQQLMKAEIDKFVKITQQAGIEKQ